MITKTDIEYHTEARQFIDKLMRIQKTILRKYPAKQQKIPGAYGGAV